MEVGDIIVIKPGEKIPLDGKVVFGESMVDTSALTGESVPRRVKEGDDLVSGLRQWKWAFESGSYQRV